MGCHAPWQSACVSHGCTIVAKDISESLVEFVINDFNIIEKHCIVMCQVTCVFEVTKAIEKSQTQMYHLLPTFFFTETEKINKFTKA